VGFGFGSGSGSTPTASLAFLASPITVTVTETNQRIHITSSRAMGSTVGINTGPLSLYVCYQSLAAGSSLVSIGGGMLGNRVPANTRVPFSLSYITPPLSSGQYQVGLCGLSANGSEWNSNEFSYTTALLFNP
jgi:hypothetical protein